MRTVAAVSLIVALGIAAFAGVTDGFSVLTSEAARRLAVRKHPLAVPDVRMVDEQGTMQSLRALLARDGRVTLVDFIYTRCNSICSVLGDEFQQLQRAVIAAGLQHRVRLLSISFDPAYDHPPELRSYARRMNADSGVWSFVETADKADLASLLSTFGIVIIPDARGGYVHNAAIHLVTPDGKLARIYDIVDFQSALQDAAILSRGERR